VRGVISNRGEEARPGLGPYLPYRGPHGDGRHVGSGGGGGVNGINGGVSSGGGANGINGIRGGGARGPA